MLLNHLKIERAGVVLALASIVSACAPSSLTENLDSTSATPLSQEPGGFVAVGDTGYISDKSGLSPVANAVREYCTARSCEFGLMAGDNIYNVGAAGDDNDTLLFHTRFTEPYGPLANLGNNFRIYVALGNHDWYTSRTGALAQVAFHKTNPPFYMDDLFYSVQPPAYGGDVEVFVIDTEMLLAPHELARFKEAEDGTMVETGESRTGGHKNALPVTDREKKQLQWFEDRLKNSTAKWKIVLAHHPLWQSRSDSKYSQSIMLRKLLLPALCRYADAYIAGHQHTQELHTDSCTRLQPDAGVKPLVHVVTGAGAKARTIKPNFQQWQQKQYPQLNHIWAKGDQWGFSYFAIQGDKLEVRMLNVAEDGSVSTGITRMFDNRP